MTRDPENGGAGEEGAGELGLLRFLRLHEDLWTTPGMPAEDRRRRGHVALCLLFIIPAILLFVVVDLRHGRSSEAAATGVLGAFLIGMLVQLLRRRPILNLARLAVAASFAVIAYDTVGGGGDGGDGLAFLWLFTQPLIVFFLFGRREGATWAAAGFALALALLAAVAETPHYVPGMGARF